MKKFISLLSVFAIICTMFTTVAFAGSDEIYWAESVDGTDVTLTLTIDSSKTVTTAKLYFDGTAAAAACDEIVVTKVDASTATFNASKKVLAFTYANVDGADKIELATVTFKNVKSSFTLPRHTTKWVVTDSTKVDFLTDMTISADGYEVKVAGPVLPADRAAAVKFAADENTFVEITKGAEVKNYFLPAGVKGDATVYGLLKYTVDGTNVASGDIFTIKAVDMETKVATDVASITVE
jgi:hypothetical protein